MLLQCPHCLSKNSSSEPRPLVVRFGVFKRKADNTTHQRFLCRACKKTFSTQTTNPCFGQKKRHLNPKIFTSLVSGESQRRLSLTLGVNRKTIVRKFIFLGVMSHLYLQELRKQEPLAHEIEFDDLETFEHSKLKPLSVTMAVESKTRRILGFRVAKMAAKGLLVKKSLQKYGRRQDERRIKREELFKELQSFVAPNATIKSDENPHYPSTVQQFFPQAVHKTYKGRRGCVVGQGELKAGGFDPIFSLNHSFAMLRANINRLFRRTWNTTKIPERLALHISMYILYHNYVLILR